MKNSAIAQAPLQLILLDRCNQFLYTNCTATEIENCAVMIYQEFRVNEMKKMDRLSIF